MSKVVRIVREPLVHFLILGGLLFAMYAYNDAPNRPRENEIVISEGTIESLMTQWQRTWQRPPTPEEFQGLINDHIREEVFYREAKRMGLEENDTIIRRRLRQKMEFLAEELAESTPLDEAALQAHYEAHAESYRRDTRYTFRQIYFRSDADRGELNETIADTVDALNRNEIVPEEAGDRTLLPAGLDDAAEREISGAFGSAFVDELAKVAPGRWTGPVTSGLGQHIVYVANKIEGEIPPLSEVRDEVERDWYIEQRTKAKDALFEEMRGQYTFRVEYPEWEGTGEGL
jgi:parvulin-like peptidyl-prolyl isomerase